MEIFKIFSASIFKTNLSLIKDSSTNADVKWKTIRDNFTEHVTKTLPLLNKSALVKIDTLGYENHFFELWNNFIDGVDNKYKTVERDLIYNFTNSLCDYLIMFVYSLDYNGTEENLQEQIITQISKFEFKLAFSTCQISNTRLNLFLSSDGIFELKKLTYKESILENGKKDFSCTIEPMSPNKYNIQIKSIDFEFKTGKLLINDWFRVKTNAFNEAVKHLDVKGSINFSNIREEQIKKYAQENMISVNIGNTCPSVYLKNGHLLIGQGPELKKGKTYKGNVCTDLWNATIIDEEEFCHKLKNYGLNDSDIAEALREVKDTWTTVQFKVEPGQYRLHYCADYEKFNQLYRRKDGQIDLGSRYKPYFVIEKL